jgi:hypothetical protein
VCVCVCPCSLSYPASKAHAPCYIVCGLSRCAISFDIISERERFSEKGFGHKIFGLSFSTNFVKKFILRIIQRDMITNLHRPSRKVPAILVRFSGNLNFLDRFSKKLQTSNFMNIHTTAANFFYHANRQANMKKLIEAFGNFENKPNK